MRTFVNVGRDWPSRKLLYDDCFVMTVLECGRTINQWAIQTSRHERIAPRRNVTGTDAKANAIYVQRGLLLERSDKGCEND